MLNSKNNVKKILKVLKNLYPHVTTQLDHKTPFELLIATILSAQCTDAQVNKVTKKLFQKFDSPESFAKANLKEMETLIYSTGFYKNKSKNIKKCCQMLIEQYNEEVPETMEELIKLPGVGRKTANVVLGRFFKISGIVVDTHVIRISQRLGFTENKTPEKIEKDLMKLVDKKDWHDFALWLVFFGRETCTARKPKCSSCPLNDLCISNI
jgi:endonuclease III